eukprot:s114_g54.t1
MGSGGSTDAKKKSAASEEKYKPEDNAGTESMDVAAMGAKPRRLKKAATRARLEDSSVSRLQERSPSPRPPDPAEVTPTTEVRPCDHCGEMRKTTNFFRGEEVLP